MFRIRYAVHDTQSIEMPRNGYCSGGKPKLCHVPFDQDDDLEAEAGYCAVIRVAGEEKGSMSETRRNKPGEVRPDFHPTICNLCQPW